MITKRYIKATLLVLIVFRVSCFFGQNENKNLELGYRNFNSINFYAGYKMKVFDQDNIFLRTGFNYIFMSTRESWNLVDKEHSFLINAGLEYRFLDKIEWITPYAGVDLIYDRVMMKRTYSFGTKAGSNKSHVGIAGIAGLRFNYKRYYLGAEVDFAYCFYYERWYSERHNDEISHDWRNALFRMPLIYLGYTF